MADILQMHDLKPAPGAKRDRIRVGRGEGSKGKTSGRGDKGTKKRYQVRPGFEGGQLPLYMRLPKLRGFKSPFKKEYQVVNVAALAELFPQGGEITVADLVAKGAVRKGQPVKVLGDGEISVHHQGCQGFRFRQGQDRGRRRLHFRGLIPRSEADLGLHE